jgi:hypothetical protein
MSRTPLPLHVGDVCAFARSLGRQLADLERTPGHVELLNMLARASGHRNFQHLRATAGNPADPADDGAAAAAALDRPDAAQAPAQAAEAMPGPAESAATQAAPAAPAVNRARVERTARVLDAEGRLLWPPKYSQQGLCLWLLWSRIPARRTFSEAEIGTLLTALHHFGDHALLRRELVDRGLMQRTPDGRSYTRIERRPPDEALALIARAGA